MLGALCRHGCQNSQTKQHFAFPGMDAIAGMGAFAGKKAADCQKPQHGWLEGLNPTVWAVNLWAVTVNCDPSLCCELRLNLTATVLHLSSYFLPLLVFCVVCVCGVWCVVCGVTWVMWLSHLAESLCVFTMLATYHLQLSAVTFFTSCRKTSGYSLCHSQLFGWEPLQAGDGMAFAMPNSLAGSLCRLGVTWPLPCPALWLEAFAGLIPQSCFKTWFLKFTMWALSRSGFWASAKQASNTLVWSSPFGKFTFTKQ